MARTPTAVIGAGKLARALIPLLGPAGYPVVAVAATRIAAARRACRGLPARTAPTATTSLSKAVHDARLVLLAVPDARISSVAADLAAATGWDNRVVLHHAGALGVEPLAPLAGVGAAVGVLHPMQSLGRADLAAKILPGSRARIAGDRRGRAAAGALARALGMKPLRLPAHLSERDRAAYHAAASLVSNDLVALVDLGIELLESIGLSRTEAREALRHLAQGTLAQTDRGLEGALTGPVPRNDVATLNEHLDVLGRQSADNAEIHRLLSRRLAALARKHGVKVSAEMRRRLQSGRAAGRGSRKG